MESNEENTDVYEAFPDVSSLHTTVHSFEVLTFISQLSYFLWTIQIMVAVILAKIYQTLIKYQAIL